MVTLRQTADNAMFPFGDYLHDSARRLVCAAIPKNACTDLKHWFLSVVEPEKLADPGLRLHAYVRATHAMARLPRAEIDAALRDSFVFAFVRDPLSRVVSGYVEKFCRPAPGELFEPAREVIGHVRGGSATAEGISFREFVRFLSDAADEQMDPHWRPQAAFVRGVRVDLLARVESSSRVLAELSGELGMPSRGESRRNATGYTPALGRCFADCPSGELYAQGLLPPSGDLYDDELRGMVLARFAEDAALYGAAVDCLTPEVRGVLRQRVALMRQ